MYIGIIHFNIIASLTVWVVMVQMVITVYLPKLSQV